MAAEEIGRQLRLRDMGGVIVIDFVDLRQEKNRRKLEKKVRDVLKTDRAKSKVLKISSFGLIEMTRQRLRPSLKQSLYSRCGHCDGSGYIMSRESVALRVMRDLQLATANDDIVEIEIGVCPEVAEHLANELRQEIADLERQTQRSIIIKPTDTLSGNDVELTCRNSRGSEVNWDSPGKGNKHKPDPGDFEDIHVLVKKSKSGSKKQSSRRDGRSDGGSDEPQADENKGKDGESDEKPKKKRRRGRRGGRKHKKKSSDDSGDDKQDENPGEKKPSSDSSSNNDSRGSNKDQDSSGKEGSDKNSGPDDQDGQKKQSSRRRRGGRGRKKSGGSQDKETSDGGENSSDSGKDDASSDKGDKKNSGRDNAGPDKAARDDSAPDQPSPADQNN
jgi:ribonuclease E